GKKHLTLQLAAPLDSIPSSLSAHQLALSADRTDLIYTYETDSERSGIADLLRDLAGACVAFKDLHTEQSSLEDIFVSLMRDAQ
ncbi:MAG TPA: multidrug ABC transporter ATP-binding protein, partial [Phenylobacterium sp.]|nr:multidrug ABC transporter ATP-binding protein [Phenylobacterium sp.]